MALIKQQSVTKGNGPLGIINQTLNSIVSCSSYATDFHDITGGSNGYSATSGYDLATGWGSPYGCGLINALAGSSSPTAAAITSPSPGSTLTGESATFTWTAGTGGVTGYYLHVGTTPGAADLANIGVGTSTSATVNLPTSGATIYVQLETHLGSGTILENNNTYTEFTQSAAAITSPSPGSTLTGASTTFTWAAGSGGVTAYYLHIGTSPGGADLVNIGVGTGTSATVTLPTNGATIYVQLETHLGSGTILENNNTYTEAP